MDRVEYMTGQIVEAANEATQQEGYLGVALSLQRAEMVAKAALQLSELDAMEVFIAGAIVAHGLTSLEKAWVLAERVVDRVDAFVSIERS